MSSTSLRIAVLTDFHAYTSRPEDKGNKPSWLDLSSDQSDVQQNPFAALRALLRDDPRLKADLVLCLGDMGDKASRDGQQYVWREVNELGRLLNAADVFGTAGNHDVDSRFKTSDFDARGQVQALEPPFPVNDERKWLEYWAKNFTIIEVRGLRLILLNSAAYHGYAKEGVSPEYHHGRVSDRTIERLVAELKAAGGRAGNLLVCHHHPFRNDKIPTGDYSEMQGGDRLINALVDTHVGPWMVIHGHKHVARVFYAPGSNASPTVFAAASFSARPYPNQLIQTHNEFYLLELEVPAALGEVMSLRGTIKTWSFSFGYGWQRPRAGIGLGPTAGFGARVDTGRLAAEIGNYLRSNHLGTPVSWSEVAHAFPDVRHLVPEDFTLLLKVLEDHHKMTLNLDGKSHEVSVVQVAS